MTEPVPESAKDDIDRDWGLNILDEMPGVRECGLRDAGRELARQFESQFDLPALAVRFYFRLLVIARRALSALCWSGPRRGAAPGRLHEGKPDPRYDPFWEAVFGREAVLTDRDESEYLWLERALAWLAANQPARAASAAPQPIPIQIPNRLDALQPQWERGGRTRPLGALAQNLARDLPAGAAPILFGSLAEDGPWPAYADVDLALWLNDTSPRAEDIRQIAAAFRRAAPLIVQVDPLQHHGPFVFFDLDRALFGESMLPAATLRRATSLNREASPPPEVLPIHDRLSSLLSLANLCHGALRLAGRPARERSDRYMAKYLVSLVLLTPALTLGAMGEPAEKAASFATLKPRLSAGARATLEGFEQIRLDWRWTLAPPSALIKIAGTRAHGLARNLNRWPAQDLGRRLAEITPGLEPLFKEFFGLIAGKR